MPLHVSEHADFPYQWGYVRCYESKNNTAQFGGL